MSNAWNFLKPKDKFSVIKNQYISETDYLVLNMLYQPILGVKAIGLLYQLLVEERIGDKKKSQRHSVLLNQLNIGIPDFYEAREKLEGLGLLKTFMKQLDSENHFIYEIQQPLSPTHFLHDDILSLLLIDKLGFEKVEQLSQFFNYERNDLGDYVEVTKSFVEAFHFDSNQLMGKQQELDTIKTLVTTVDKTYQVNLKIDTFDWNFFMSLIDSLHIQKVQIEEELKKTIELFHRLYGINELEMLDYIKQSVDYMSNRINEKEFKQIIYKGYHSKRQQEKSEDIQTDVTKNPLTETEKEQLRKNTLRLTGFNDQEIAVILSCESVPPLIFLKSLKQQKGGFVSSNERWTVENLKTQSRLPDSVINILIHYLLIAQGNSSLNQNMSMSIANDWAQKQIFSPEKALLEVKKVKKEKVQTTTRNKKTYQKNKRKETLPDWAQEDNKRKDTPLSKEETIVLQNQLKQLNDKQKEGGN